MTLEKINKFIYVIVLITGGKLVRRRFYLYSRTSGLIFSACRFCFTCCPLFCGLFDVHFTHSEKFTVFLIQLVSKLSFLNIFLMLGPTTYINIVCEVSYCDLYVTILSGS